MTSHIAKETIDVRKNNKICRRDRVTSRKRNKINRKVNCRKKREEIKNFLNRLK